MPEPATAPSVIVQAGARRRQHWYVLARSPHNRNQCMPFIKHFGLSEESEQAMLKVRERMVRDRKFRMKWEGWWFEPVLVNAGISFQVDRFVYAWEQEVIVGN